jgi:hypothetical protein
VHVAVCPSAYMWAIMCLSPRGHVSPHSPRVCMCGYVYVCVCLRLCMGAGGGWLRFQLEPGLDLHAVVAQVGTLCARMCVHLGPRKSAKRTWLYVCVSLSPSVCV